MRTRRKLTYANVMATLAVFVALGGASYAASQLPKNSVGTKQIKPNAVNSSKVANGTLLPADFKNKTLPAGPKGETGPPGTPGTPANEERVQEIEGWLQSVDEGLTEVEKEAFTYAVVRDEMLQSNLGETKEKTVMCEPGEVATGGGYAGGNDSIQIIDSAPADPSSVVPPDGWRVKAKNNYGNSYAFTVYAVCAG